MFSSSKFFFYDDKLDSNSSYSTSMVGAAANFFKLQI